jgi:hypothetical protein
MALPPISSQPAPRLPPASDSRATAQRAFFEAALGRAPAPLAATSAPAERAKATNPPAAAAPVDAPQRPANAAPGSLLNIVV